ncbi:MAG: hypothetical protein ABI612_03990 [Betaproteobacteria bacterium]
METSDICVAHLVRARNGTEPLEHFLASYDRHRAGIDHDLLFILKGFAGDKIDPATDAILNRYRHLRMFTPDWGYDVTAYFRAVKRHAHPVFCLLNSFSEILADDWLCKVHRAFSLPGVGVAGATGSYQGYREDWKHLPKSSEFAMRPQWKESLLKLPLVDRLSALRHRWLFASFPNPHIRTNAMMLKRELMLSLTPQVTLTKMRAYKFESGKHGMTTQILSLGKKVLIVGRDGTIYDIAEWRDSNIFWKGDQQNLLIADNQTRRYEAADMETRKIFSWWAWGTDQEHVKRTGREPAWTPADAKEFVTR